MTDQNGQERAGQNVGNEPSLLNFIEKAGSIYTQVPLTGVRTVLLEGVDGAVRSNLIQAEGAGRMFNDGAAQVDVSFFFEDGQGNELAAGGLSIPAGGSAPIPFISLPCLAPGEKLTIEAVEYGG
jgi:hypothetical protein